MVLVLWLLISMMYPIAAALLSMPVDWYVAGFIAGSFLFLIAITFVVAGVVNCLSGAGWSGIILTTIVVLVVMGGMLTLIGRSLDPLASQRFLAVTPFVGVDQPAAAKPQWQPRLAGDATFTVDAPVGLQYLPVDDSGAVPVHRVGFPLNGDVYRVDWAHLPDRFTAAHRDAMVDSLATRYRILTRRDRRWKGHPAVDLTLKGGDLPAVAKARLVIGGDRLVIAMAASRSSSHQAAYADRFLNSLRVH